MFTEVEKSVAQLVRQRVLSCIKVLAIHHFESAVGELLDSPDFSASILGALQVLTNEKPLLLRLLNHLTDMLNNSDSGNKRPTRLGLAAAMALGQSSSLSATPGLSARVDVHGMEGSRRCSANRGQFEHHPFSRGRSGDIEWPLLLALAQLLLRLRGLLHGQRRRSPFLLKRLWSVGFEKFRLDRQEFA